MGDPRLLPDPVDRESDLVRDSSAFDHRLAALAIEGELLGEKPCSFCRLSFGKAFVSL
jgi:hypothetical protein